MPPITYPPELPVSARAEEIAELIRRHQVLVVCGETGSGKSTQLPRICLAAGRGVHGMIGHTQPRRLAARAIAGRLAEELGTTVGDLVGFTVRFTDATRPETLVKVMTDGILLAEIPRDRMLRAYDTIIIDEAHERGLNIDFLLGYLRTLLPRRPDLRLIITSATIDPERFSRHFGDAPIVEVSGRTYPVEVRWRPIDGASGEADAEREPAPTRPAGGRGRGRGRGPSGRPGGGGRRDRAAIDADAAGLDAGAFERPAVAAVEELLRERDAGDVLVFLPGEREIRDLTRALRRSLGLGHGHGDGRTADGTQLEILPLYARLSVAEQQRIFRPHPGRRIVLATNVAETSITVPGIRSVVDTGLARISRYGVRTKVQQLPVEPISQASAAQRSGRCGRIAPGICIRLYSEADFEQREQFTAPEIRRTNLAGVILRMKSMRLGDPLEFPFVEPPRRAAVRDGLDTLHELGAIDAREQLTDIGRRLARIPVDPRQGRILLAGLDEDCLDEAAILAAALAVPDPRDRPVERRDAADEAHRRFRHESSDFLSLLRIWDAFEDQRRAGTSGALRRWCEQHFLSWVRMREWRDLHRQLLGLVPEAGRVRRRDGGRGGGERTNLERAPADAIHRAVLGGLLSNVGVRDEETGVYRGVRGGEFVLHPSSTLHRASPEWVMAAEVVETTRRYARTVAAIRPQWLETVAAHLLRKRHAEPRWDRASGRVVCTERLTLFGRELGRGRTADFGPVDPPKARELFIHHGLVERDFDCTEEFFAHNGRLLEELAELERRRRRHDVLADASLQFDFYDRRLPATVRDARSLKQWLGEAAGGGGGGGGNRGRGRGRRGGEAGGGPLHMQLEDLMALPTADRESAADGPRGERLRVGDGGGDAAPSRPLAAAA
ncbi:MAG: ATP-dependent RNA helicase HrpA, partial [Planctomycetota bacterium]